ncbi:MAG: GMC oxidoreductase [Spirochaetia bacterium]|nr:GMC oxidoreductase [Spirochaetia bacterium]
MNQNKQIDFDFAVIGSGFGGSVSALRLSQKGYSVIVIESGKRYESENFPKTNWSLRKFFWMPKLFAYGIQRIKIFKDVFVLAGSGVGGGSLVYCNTSYIPPDIFFENKKVTQMGGRKTLLPFFNLVRKMLGVTENPQMTKQDTLLYETAKEFKKEKTFQKTHVAVCFGPEKKIEDPYFLGEGPDRAGCNFCGGCMVGCRYNAKNTLDKNYLFFAEKLGAKIMPETKVVKVLPLSENGSEGYEVITNSTTGFMNLSHKKIKVKSVVFAAGVLGNLELLLKMKEQKILPNLSENLGKDVRTNSEVLLGVKSKDNAADFTKGVSITSSVFPDEYTHIEPVRYSKGSDAMGLLAASLLVDGGGRVPRALKFFVKIIKNPFDFIRVLNFVGFAKKVIILLVMQTKENKINIIRKRKIIWPFKKILVSSSVRKDKIPTYVPIANEFARKLAKKMNGIPSNAITEVLFNMPLTAHILSGCAMGKNSKEGVIDFQNKVFSYENMYICDGSVMPANPGVNPSSTIAALAERAMSFVPAKAKFKHLKVEKKWKVEKLINPRIMNKIKKTN